MLGVDDVRADRQFDRAAVRAARGRAHGLVPFGRAVGPGEPRRLEVFAFENADRPARKAVLGKAQETIRGMIGEHDRACAVNEENCASRGFDLVLRRFAPSGPA